MPTQVPSKYLDYNSQSNKKLSVVVKIDGLSDLLTSTNIYTKTRYGDPVVYGQEGIVYGGLRPLENVKTYLSLEGSSLTISQRLEPEQGRASVSTVSLSFIDKDGYFTALCSPGVVLDDILGKEVTIYLGYQELSFPEDFFVIFRGRISGVQIASGMCNLTISDPNIARKQNIFFTAKTTLVGALSAGATSLTVASNGDFYKSILGPNGAYDSGVKLYLKIEDEYIEYGPSYTLPFATFGTNTFSGVSRGARGTTAATHADGSDVEARIELTGNVIDLALKIMFSGWNGPYLESVALYSIVKTTDPILGDIPGSIILPALIDAVKDYGLAVGDYITISGASNGANNTTCRITRFADLFAQPNRIIYTDGALVIEQPTSAIMAVRSQYDTLPVSCGVSLPGKEVDVSSHVSLKNQFLGTSDYTFRFFISSQTTAKTFIESELFLPTSAYSLTKAGRLSVGLTHPPIADQTLLFLTADNILDPQNTKPRRDLNQSRKFFNEISYAFDANDDGNPTKTVKYLDSDSLNIIGLSSQLPITSRGARTDIGFPNVAERQAKLLLSRYKRGATILECKVNWEVGNRIESGDVVAVQDGGILKIANFSTGTRDLGTQLFEVVDRSLSIKDGNVGLKLISGIGTSLTDRYATIAPSSMIASGSTPTTVIIQDSYGALFPGFEQGKWADYVGQDVLIHSQDWSVQGVGTLLGFDPAAPYAMQISGLMFTPMSGYIVEIIEYPTTTDIIEAQTYKQIHAFLMPQVTVTSGSSTTQFFVSLSDISKFQTGFPVRVHNASYSIDSGDNDIFITAVDNGTGKITVGTSLGFTPSAGQLVDLLGFADGGGPYRFI